MSNPTDWYFVRQCSTPTIHHVKIGISSIGRDITAFIVCSNLAVSKKHAVISTRENRHIYIRDNNTTNGTFINDERLPPGQFCLLLEDDIITFAKPKSMMVDLNNEYCFKLMKEKRTLRSDKLKDQDSVRQKKEHIEDYLERELQEIHNISQSPTGLDAFRGITAQPDQDAQKALDEMTRRARRKGSQEKFKLFQQKSIENGNAGDSNCTKSSGRRETQESCSVRQRPTGQMEKINKRAKQKSIEHNEVPAESVPQKSTEHSKPTEKGEQPSGTRERKSENETNRTVSVELDVQPTSTEQQKSKATNEKGRRNSIVNNRFKETIETVRRQRSKSTGNRKLEDVDERVQPKSTRNTEVEEQSSSRAKSKSTEKMELNKTDSMNRGNKKLEDVDERVQPKSTRNTEVEEQSSSIAKSKSTEKMELNKTDGMNRGNKKLEDVDERVQPKLTRNVDVEQASSRAKSKSAEITLNKTDDKNGGNKKLEDIDERVLPTSNRNTEVEQSSSRAKSKSVEIIELKKTDDKNGGNKKLEDIDERVLQTSTRNTEVGQLNKTKSKSVEIIELNKTKSKSIEIIELNKTNDKNGGNKKLEDADERVHTKSTKNKDLAQTNSKEKPSSTEKVELNKTDDNEQTPGQKILEKSTMRANRKSIGQQQLEETIERVKQKISEENKLVESRKRGRPKSIKPNKSDLTNEKAVPDKKKLEKTNVKEQKKTPVKKQPVVESVKTPKINKTVKQKPATQKETKETTKRVSPKVKETNKKMKPNPPPQEEKEPKVTTRRKEIIEKAKIVPSTKKKLEISNHDSTVFKIPDLVNPKGKRVTFSGFDDSEKNTLGKRQRSMSMCVSLVSEVKKKIPNRRQTIFIDPLPPVRRSPRTRSKTVETTTPIAAELPLPAPKKSILKSPSATSNSSEIDAGTPQKGADKINSALRKRSYSLYSVIPDNRRNANEEISGFITPEPSTSEPACKMKFQEFNFRAPDNSPNEQHQIIRTFERRPSTGPILMQRPPLFSETLHNRSYNSPQKMERSRSIIGYVDDSCRSQIPRSRSIMGNIYTSDESRVSTFMSSNAVPNENFLPEHCKTFLSHVIRWNPSWLEEYLRHDDTLPPIFHESKNDIPVMLYTYSNFEAYSDTITSLIILEVWEAAFTAYKAIRSSGEKLNFILCSQPPKAFVGTKITKITLRSKDRNVVSSRMGSCMLLLVNFPELTKCANRWFIGLIDAYEYKASAGSRGMKEVFMTVYVRLDPQLLERVQTYSMIHIKPLTYIKNEMAMVRAVYDLQLSELKNMIICPREIFFKKFQSLSPLQWKHHLNASQLKAVTQCICAISSNMPSIQIIQGPPGTGKSRVIVSIVMEYLQRTFKSHARGKVLICAQTNIAIDEIVKRLLECRENMTCERKFSLVRVGRCERMQPHALEVCSTTLAKKFENNPDISYQIKLLRMNIAKFANKLNSGGPQGAYSEVQHAHYTKKLDDLLTHSSSPGNLLNEEFSVIGKADVIATTLQGCSQKKLQVLRNKVAFCIVDEAAKATEPEILIPLSLGVKSLHLVGDHQQLPAFVSSHHAKRKGLSDSLFTRLIHCCECWEHACIVPLNVQYRMHPDIAHFPNLAFYEGKLKNGLEPAPLPRVLPPYRVLYVKGNTKDQDESGVNSEEAKIVAKLSLAIASYIRNEKLNLSFCVLTPYSGQKDAILMHMRTFSEHNEIDVSTVDSFQGQERDVVVISCARSSGTGFLDDPGRMSVLLTRAKRSCIICCNPEALKKQSLWASLLEDADTRQMSRPLPKKIQQYTNEDDNRKKFLNYLL